MVSSSEVIINGFLIINDTKIESAGKTCDLTDNRNSQVIDFGNSAIMPGFVNAHTHLELTNLHGLEVEDKKLPTWIWQLMKTKMKWKEPDFESSLINGVKQSLESGTTTVYDITNSGYAYNVLQNQPIRKVIFDEVIALDPVHCKTVLDTAKEKLEKIDTSNNLLDIGISPHAPYTVSPELFAGCTGLADELNLPLCTHIAETEDEIEFLTEGTGLFADFLRKLRLLSKDWIPPGKTPINFLNSTGILNSKPVLIHCNYLTNDEISIISESGCSVIYCPRSHKFFEHKDHPLQKLLNKGINVAIGTDSLASNYSLSILDEMRTIRSTFHQVEPQTIIDMATINGAAALGLDDKFGKLRNGYYADLAVIKLPDKPEDDVFSAILSDNSENIFTMVNGAVCFDKFNCAAK